MHGRNGATSRDILEKIVPDAQRADVYVISCGVNDATHGVPVRKFAHSFERIVGTLRRKSPRAAILYGGLPPLGSFPALPWPLSAILAERVTSMQAAARTILARDRRAHCFDFPPTMPPDELASDGFHPAEHACERWAHGLLELWPREPQRDGSPAPTLHGRRRRLSRRQRAVRGDTTGPR